MSSLKTLAHTCAYDPFIQLLPVCDEFNDLSYLITTDGACTTRPLSTLLRHFNLVTFTKFETLERFKLTQLFVYHVHGTNVTHCVDGKYGGLAAGTNKKIIKINNENS